VQLVRAKGNSGGCHWTFLGNACFEALRRHIGDGSVAALIPVR